ncbi:MAG: hypothetical protein M3Q10_20090 [Chloroflexota bacterium]|nr:hypothetical protein [Chloroflexota bacterium]
MTTRYPYDHELREMVARVLTEAKRETEEIAELAEISRKPGAVEAAKEIAAGLDRLIAQVEGTVTK